VMLRRDYADRNTGSTTSTSGNFTAGHITQASA
jgi:hypothetical protein